METIELQTINAEQAEKLLKLGFQNPENIEIELALKFLREEYNVHATINMLCCGKGYFCDVYNKKGIWLYGSDSFDTYEESQSQALDLLLDHLSNKK